MKSKKDWLAMRNVKFPLNQFHIQQYMKSTKDNIRLESVTLRIHGQLNLFNTILLLGMVASEMFRKQLKICRIVRLKVDFNNGLEL
jgi:hypothetical protein